MDEKRSIRSMLHTSIGNDKRQNLFSSPPPSFFALHERQRTNSYEDLFTVTAKSKGDIGSVTDLSDSVPTPIGRPRRGWSKRSKLLIALAVFVVVIVALCAYLAVATIGKNGSGDSKADDEAAIQPDTDTTTDKEEPMKSSTLSTKPITRPESTPAPSGEWTSWDSWTACSVTCGSGVQERNRNCNKVDPTYTDCEGENTQQVHCTVSACPQSEWTSWDSWTACSVTCGSGVQERNRTCNKVDHSDADCEGDNLQQAVCTLNACPQTEWTSWDSWTACSVTCGSGVQERNRTCNKVDPSDADCEGDNLQQAVCTLNACPQTEWAPWDSWTACSVTCGSGVQERNRTCNKVDPNDADCGGQSTQQAECTVDACPQTEWTSWNSWTACSVTCGSGGVQIRNRACNKVDPADADCEGGSTQQSDCTADVCPPEWTSWGSWTTCTAMCGSGVHTRYRTCNNTKDTDAECEGGQYVEQAVCTLDDCSVYGKWTTWSQWGNCGATCGGGVRSRSRQCNKASSSDLDCVGDTAQQTTCNEWDCPDCGKTCSVGMLNAACDTCVCELSNIQGRVLSTTRNPVNFADIAADTAPLTVIVQTNSTGFFNLGNTCIGSTVIVSRQGFQDAVVQITATYQIIYLEFEVLPRITEHPQSKYRITGENVLLCCSAVGAPSITYYEWFYDGILLDRNLYTDNGTGLELKNVQPSQSGEYTCRANNEGRGIYSNKATLSIRDNEDYFCEDAFQQKQVKLPEACAQPGRDTTLYEVGECASKTCRQANTNDVEQCRDSSKSCCIPSKFETKTVNCTGYEVDLIVIKACSCGSCDTTSSVQVSGKVVNAKSGSAVQLAEVWLNGVLETYTSNTGSFYITVSDSIGKAVFTIKDTYNNIYLDTTKVVEVGDGMGGSISVEILMLEMSDPVAIDSSTESVFSLGGPQNDSGNPIAMLNIPANSFYRSDGSAYTGIVSAFVTFIDPTDENTQDAIPGVFQFIDEEGSNIDLESKGMFNLQFKDEAGNDLIVNGAIEVSFPDQAADNFTLWKMNTVSGLWEALTPSVQANARKRRQAAYQAENVIGEIDMSILPYRDYVNIDKLRARYAAGPVCYSKSRLYKDESLSEEINDISANYYTEYRRVVGQTLVTFNSGEYPTGCFKFPCDNALVYLSLKTYNSYFGYRYKLMAAQPMLTDGNPKYKIVENSTAIGVFMTSNYYGPFYQSINTCKISNKQQSHFRFYKLLSRDIYTARYFSPGGRPIGENRKLMDKVWYPKRESLHTICLIKLKISFSTLFISSYTSFRVHVKSFGGILTQVENFLFGIRQYEVDVSETSKYEYICAEYKCSGKLEQSDEEDFTRVKIFVDFPSSHRCQIQNITDNIESLSLKIDQNKSYREPYWQRRSSRYFDAYIPNSYGSSWGVYEAHTPIRDFETTREKVDNECNTKYEQQNEGAAVHLYC